MLKKLVPAALLLACELMAQGKFILNVAPAGKATEGKNLPFRIELRNATQLSELTIFVRPVGETNFAPVEVKITGSNFVSASIPAKFVKAPAIELFIEAVSKSGERFYYPKQDRSEFLKIPVSPSRKTELVVLSPEPGSRVVYSDLVISVSLIYVTKKFDLSKTQVFIDRRNVTKFAVISPEFVLFVPENAGLRLRTGTHTATVVLRDTASKIVDMVRWEFSIITPAELAAERRRLNYGGGFEVELRNETLQKVSTSYARARIRFNGGYGSLGFRTNFYLTSEEKKNIQPQNRFFIGGNLGDWITVGFGDNYPSFSPLILRGIRVRGIYGKVDLRYFQVEVINGEIRRGIEGTVIKSVPLDSLAGRQLPENSIYDSTTGMVKLYNYGTYRRTLFSIRPALKYKRNFELGLSYLVSKDDTASIKFGGNARKNIVFGPDLKISLDNARFQFRAFAAISVSSDNIKAPSWTESDIDSIFKDTPSVRDNLKKFKPTIEKFLPLNQYITPINPLGLSSLAYEANLSLNYFGNFLRVSYIRRGSDYRSFGQPFLRSDIKGFKFFDRLRLFRNQLFLTFRLENLKDNTQKQLSATTSFINWEASVMYSPLANLPTVSFSFGRFLMDNKLSPDTLIAINTLTTRYNLNLSYNFELLFRNRLSAFFSYSSSNDRTIRNFDYNTLNIGVVLYSDVSSNLRANFIFNLSNSKFMRPEEERRFNYISTGIGADYNPGRFRVYVNLVPSFGDLKRFYLISGATYNITGRQSLELNSNLLFNPSYVDVVAYLTYRISF